MSRHSTRSTTKQNVWGLVYGGMGRETERDDNGARRKVDRGVEYRDSGREAVQGRLNGGDKQ